MTRLLTWFRSNPLSVVALVAALAAVGLLMYVQIKGSEFVDRMAQRATTVQKLEQLERTSKTIPPESTDAPPQTLTGVINQPAIDKITRIYTDMETEHAGIRQLALQINQTGHAPAMEGLFPVPRDEGSPFDFKRVYADAFADMLGAFDAEATGPRLDAGGPVPEEQVKTALDQIQHDYLTKTFTVAKTSVAELTPEQLNDLIVKKRMKLFEVMRSHAQRIHIYAVTDPASDLFPFDVGQWSLPTGGKPSPQQMWGGQMSLWIQQDIARAIMMTNRVDDPLSNVIGVPIKRLIKIQVVPGYVGIPNTDFETEGEQATVAAGKSDETVELPREDFALQHTGRRSNDVYDVRYAHVTVVIESRKIPLFLENLAKVNFMTALRLSMNPVDEYRALESGYMYGPGNLVELGVLVETIWLREWTSKLMPPVVRERLGIKQADEAGVTARAGR